jgi:hypothetical protein
MNFNVKNGLKMKGNQRYTYNFTAESLDNSTYSLMLLALGWPTLCLAHTDFMWVNEQMNVSVQCAHRYFPNT